MNSTYSSIERCNTQTITFNPNHLDYRDRLMQLKAGDLLMCQDYAAIGAMETYLWSISQDADVSNPFGVINVNSASGFLILPMPVHPMKTSLQSCAARKGRS